MGLHEAHVGCHKLLFPCETREIVPIKTLPHYATPSVTANDIAGVVALYLIAAFFRHVYPGLSLILPSSDNFDSKSNRRCANTGKLLQQDLADLRLGQACHAECVGIVIMETVLDDPLPLHRPPPPPRNGLGEEPLRYDFIKYTSPLQFVACRPEIMSCSGALIEAIPTFKYLKGYACLTQKKAKQQTARSCTDNKDLVNSHDSVATKCDVVGEW